MYHCRLQPLTQMRDSNLKVLSRRRCLKSPRPWRSIGLSVWLYRLMVLRTVMRRQANNIATRVILVPAANMPNALLRSF